MTPVPATVVDETLPDAPPAPSGRADTGELALMLEAVHHSPMLKALLDWIDGTVLVLNHQRQILLARTTPSTPLGDLSADQMVGRRLGEVVGCRFSDVGEDGCGTSRSCRFCGALHAMLDARKGDDPVDSQCRIDLVRPEGGESVRYRVRASRTGEGEHEFTVLVLQHFDDIQTLQEPGPRARPGRDWPADLKNFLQVRRLGSGGMGTVFLVEDAKGERFALKTLRPDTARKTRSQDRFVQEMELTAALDHPNITRTVEFAQTRTGVLYMITEYVPNGTAQRWLQELGPLPVSLVLHWMVGAARALDYAWRRHHLVHRDIKPDNLLVGEANSVKLADFGIARSLSADNRLTLVGSVLGTPQYMAPEQAMGTDELDTRADLYALGSTAFYLLSGTYPFDGPDPLSIMTQKVNEDPPSIRRRRRNLPRPLSALLDALLSRDPAGRPDDPAALGKLLLATAAREGIDMSGVGALRLPTEA